MVMSMSRTPSSCAPADEVPVAPARFPPHQLVQRANGLGFLGVGVQAQLAGLPDAAVLAREGVAAEQVGPDGQRIEPRLVVGGMAFDKFGLGGHVHGFMVAGRGMNVQITDNGYPQIRAVFPAPTMALRRPWAL